MSKYLTANPHPFIGRLKIEVIRDDIDEYFKKKAKTEIKGVSQEFLDKLELPRVEDTYDMETGAKITKFVTNIRMPVAKGIIVEKASDAYGKLFQDTYGTMEYVPQVGDIVWFIANQSYRIDVEDKYHFIADDNVVGYLKSSEAN